MPFEILHLAFPGWGLFWTGSLGCSWPQSLQLARLPDLLELGTIAYFDSYVYDTALRAQRQTRSWDRQSEMDW